VANRQPVKITADIYSELTVQDARATTRAKMFCMHCSLLMFACDIPYSTLLSPVYTIQPIAKQVVKLKEREPLYLTLMTGFFHTTVIERQKENFLLADRWKKGKKVFV